MFGTTLLSIFSTHRVLDEQRRVRRVVGHDDHVAPDRLAAAKLRLDLPEEARVVVDVLDVPDLDAVLLRELVERRVAMPLDVDVERPVREDRTFCRGACSGRARPRPRPAPRSAPGTASAAPPTAARRSRSERVSCVVIRSSSGLVASTTNAASGLNESSTMLAPGCSPKRSGLQRSGRTLDQDSARRLDHVLRRDSDVGRSMTRPAIAVRLARADADLLRANADGDAARSPCRASAARATRTSPPRSSRTAQAPATVPYEQVGHAEEAGDECRRSAARTARSAIRAARSGRPCMTAIVVGHRHRLLLVVRDVDERDAELVLDRLQLELHLLAQLQVERAERLVQQQDARTVDESAGERDPLLLAAGELPRLPLTQALADRPSRGSRRPGRARRAPFTTAAARPERDVLGDRQMREERIRLEDGVDVALVRRQPDDVASPR